MSTETGRGIEAPASPVLMPRYLVLPVSYPLGRFIESRFAVSYWVHCQKADAVR
jgi:hypothetical protein